MTTSQPPFVGVMCGGLPTEKTWMLEQARRNRKNSGGARSLSKNVGQIG